jgi:hypothetical protein
VIRAALLAGVLAGCADEAPGGAPLAAIAHELRPGVAIVCVESVIKIGLPLVWRATVIGFTKRTLSCRLERDGPP